MIQIATQRAEYQKLLDARVKLEARLATMRQQRTELQSLLELAKSKEIVVKTIKSLDDLAGSGDTDISPIAQSLNARLDKATAVTEIRAASLDEPIDQILSRELINQQLAERKKKLFEKTLTALLRKNTSSNPLEVFFCTLILSHYRFEANPCSTI